MTTEQQNKAWACLPKEARNTIQRDYEYYLKRYEAVKANTAKGAIDALEDLFGHHNLTSDTEPEEMLMVERKEVIDRYSDVSRASTDNWISQAQRDLAFGQKIILNDLFGDKCLPDKDIPSAGSGEISTTPPAHKLDVKQHPTAKDIAELIGVEYDESLAPKFKVGDKFRFKKNPNKVHTVASISKKGLICFWEEDADGLSKQYLVNPEYIEPYTEPEHRNLSQSTSNCDKVTRNILSDEELDNIIFELIRIRDNRRENNRELSEILAKLKSQNTEQ